MILKKKYNPARDSKKMVIAHFEPKSPISEQFRTLRTNIQFSSIDDSIRSIVVTSSYSNEGKTTTVANLAVVIAQQGKRVLLIDADIRKPSLHYMFGQDNRIGVTNVLTKQFSLEEAVTKSDLKTLDLLTSGPIPPNPSELLSCGSMKKLLDEALDLYDIVLIDSPPTLAVTDAQILADLCHGAILIVNSGKTEKTSAKQAIANLEKAKAKLLGIVLNNMKGKLDSYYGV